MRRLLVVLVFAGCGKKADAPAPSPGSPPPPPPPPSVDAPAPVPDASTRPDASPPPDATVAVEPSTERPDYLATLCPQVLPKIVECQKDPAFIAALDAGASAKDKKRNAELRREVAKWPENLSCADLAPAYQYGGFLYHWDKLAAVPDALASCAKLGAALQVAGGLFGGDEAN